MFRESVKIPKKPQVCPDLSSVSILPMTLAIFLGVAPKMFAWTPGTASPSAAAGFVVNPMDRTDVLAFYNTIYAASQNYANTMTWTGNVGGGVAGTTGTAFKEDVQRRINFYRAMSGLPADITLDATKSAKCQEAALMFARNSSLSHYPPSSWLSYTGNGYEAAGKSNIALGNYGPGAIDAYIRDDGAGNEIAGHRRWINYSRGQSMGTGDVPAQSSYYSSNALWVIGDAKPAPTPKFVAWPNHGYVPFNLVPARWSLSYPGANFAGATVTMTQGAATIPTTIISNADVGYADNTLVWTPNGLPASISTDMPYSVTVAGISGSGIPTSHSYTVTLFDPSLLNAFPTIVGSDTPPASGATYAFGPIAQADAYELRVTTASGAAWNEGAEDPATQIVPSTTGTYPLRQTVVKRSGAKAFQLAFPSFTDQSFVIARDIIPSSASYFRFHHHARYATTTTTIHAEISTDYGNTWAKVWGRYGVGLSSNLWDSGFNEHSVNLAPYAGQIVRIRFILRWNGQSITTGTTSSHGFFIDDVSVTNATELVNETIRPLAGSASSFTLDATTAGAPLVPGTVYYLRVRPNVGTRWFSYGPPKIVTARPATGYASWVATLYPAVTGGPTDDHDSDGLKNGVEYAFGLDPTAANPGSALPQPTVVGDHHTVSFAQPVGVTDVVYGMQWSRNLTSWSPVAHSGNAGIHTFSVSKVGESQMYFRYQIEVDP
jgi:Cysteine-rich secretory protein family